MNKKFSTEFTAIPSWVESHINFLSGYLLGDLNSKIFEPSVKCWYYNCNNDRSLELGSRHCNSHRLFRREDD